MHLGGEGLSLGTCKMLQTPFLSEKFPRNLMSPQMASFLAPFWASFPEADWDAHHQFGNWALVCKLSKACTRSHLMHPVEQVVQGDSTGLAGLARCASALSLSGKTRMAIVQPCASTMLENAHAWCCFRVPKSLGT